MAGASTIVAGRRTQLWSTIAFFATGKDYRLTSLEAAPALSAACPPTYNQAVYERYRNPRTGEVLSRVPEAGRLGGFSAGAVPPRVPRSPRSARHRPRRRER